MSRLIPALLTAGLTAPLLASPALPDPVTSFELDNGMQVVVIEDHRAPVVVNMVWYRVGAADEPPGRSGIAHFLEHLLFQGTDELAPGEFSATVEANGGSDNAFTSQDYTGYFQRVASDRLELMMKMEADRMVDLKILESDVVTERDVIIEERNQRTENNPGALFSEQRMAAQYINHPYGIPIIGWKHEMEALSRSDALDFYKLYYAPNNAIAIVAGDVTPQEVRRLAQKHYGPLPANPAITPRLRPSSPPQLAERRVIYSDPRVSEPYIIRTYLAPERDSGDQKAAAALMVLADLLGGAGATSVLGRALMFDSDRAVYTSAFYTGISLDDTTFGLVTVPKPGISLEDAEADLDRVLDEFLETGVNPEQMARTKMLFRSGQIYGKDALQGRARAYGTALTAGLTIADIEAWPDILQAVTEEDVMQAARDVFDRRRAVTGWIMPKEVTQ